MGAQAHLHEGAGGRDFPDKSQALTALPLGGPQTPVSSLASLSQLHLQPHRYCDTSDRASGQGSRGLHILYCTGGEGRHSTLILWKAVSLQPWPLLFKEA